MKFYRFLGIIFSVQLISTLAFAAVNEEKEKTPQVLPTASKVDTPFVLAKDGTTPTEYYNAGVELQNSGKMEEAVKSYTQAVNRGKNDPILRSKAFQNIGVIQHESARAVMAQNPEECLKILDKAEQSYKESMKLHSGKDISVNQQILLNDRKKAEEIIKNRKEMEQKKNEAKEKTKEALDKQQQANQEKNKQQKEKKQNNANEKTQQAQQAVQDYKNSADKNNSQQDQQSAGGAQQDLKDARQDQQNGKGKEAEQKLKEALDKLGEQNQQQNQNQQGNNSQQGQEQDKKQEEQKRQNAENKQDKPDKGDKGDNDTKQQPNIPDKLPRDQSGRGEQRQYDSNDIPKDQAESVIKMMTDDEKSLNEALKDKEKEAYGLQGVEKDW